MIIDSHTHAWRMWPYKPEVPDIESHGIIEQLIYEMEQNDVDMAIVVSARIGQNEDNNDYVAECVRKYPTRLIQFADVDCSWTKTYHTDGADKRLAESAIKYSLKGFTHYLRDDDNCDWFFSKEGEKFFQVTEDFDLIVSLAIGPHQQASLRKLAKKFQSIPFLCHHVSGASSKETPPFPKLKEILASASVPNIYIKLSGFAYISQVPWDYPYYDTSWIIRAIYEHFGPWRLCWGSDYPVVRPFMTYKQAIEVFRTHCHFIPDSDKEQILGKNLYRLLTEGHSKK